MALATEAEKASSVGSGAGAVIVTGWKASGPTWWRGDSGSISIVGEASRGGGPRGVLGTDAAAAAAGTLTILPSTVCGAAASSA